MKQGHFAMLFCLLYAVCFLSLLAEQKRYDMVLEEIEQIEKALLEAIESTAMQLAGVINDSDVKKKELLESVFFETFFCHKWVLKFVKGFFCIYWDDHMFFIFQFVNMVYHIDLHILKNP